MTSRGHIELSQTKTSLQLAALFSLELGVNTTTLMSKLFALFQIVRKKNTLWYCVLNVLGFVLISRLRYWSSEKRWLCHNFRPVISRLS